MNTSILPDSFASTQEVAPDLSQPVERTQRKRTNKDEREMFSPPIKQAASETRKVTTTFFNFSRDARAVLFSYARQNPLPDFYIENDKKITKIEVKTTLDSCAFLQPSIIKRVKVNKHSCKASDLLIIEAICQKDLKNLKKFLLTRSDLQIDINKTLFNEETGLTCLHWAIHHKNIDCVKFLIEEKNAEIDLEKNIENEWFSAIARILKADPVDEESLQMAQYLTQKGMDLNQIFMSDGGSYNELTSSCMETWATPAGYYAKIGDLKRLQIIHSLGADLNSLDSRLKTPLYLTVYALLDESTELIDDGKHLLQTALYLIDNGAELGLKRLFILENLEAFIEENIIPERTPYLQVLRDRLYAV